MVPWAEFGFQRQRAGGKGRARRDDGDCLTTLGPPQAGLKGGVGRQAPSRPGIAAETRMEPTALQVTIIEVSITI